MSESDLILKTPELRTVESISRDLRKRPGAIRSEHPKLSLVAWGKTALEITEGQTLDFGLGESSPLFSRLSSSICAICGICRNL